MKKVLIAAVVGAALAAITVAANVCVGVEEDNDLLDYEKRMRRVRL